MGRIIATGTLSPVPQAVEHSYDPSRGLQVQQRWESVGSNLYSLAEQYRSLGISYNFTPSTSKSVLIASASNVAGQPDVVTDTWQILANENQKSLYEHPRSLALASVNDEVITQIQKGIEENKKRSELTPALAGDAILLFDLIKRGTTHFALGQYVLKHTTNVGNNYAANVADVNIERLYTTAQLISETTNTNAWAFTLPGRLVYKIQNLAAPTPASGYLWSWRKLPSTETSAANNRIEISTEYWLELWSTYIYQLAT